MSRIIFMAVLALVVCARPGPAEPPGSREEAARLLGLGVDLQKSGRHLEAIRIFDDAFATVPHVKIRYYKLKSLLALGRMADAAELLDAIAGDPDLADRKKDLEEMRKVLDQALAPVPVRIVTRGASGAQVTLDGRPAGTTPLLAQLRPRSYRLETTLDGHEPDSRTIQVVPSTETVEVEIVLRPIVQGTMPGEDPAPKPMPPTAPKPAPERPSTWVQWTLIGAGTATALGSIGFFAKHAADASERKELEASGRRVDQSPVNLALGGVFAGVGVALAATDLILWPWAGRPGRQSGRRGAVRIRGGGGRALHRLRWPGPARDGAILMRPLLSTGRARRARRPERPGPVEDPTVIL